MSTQEDSPAGQMPGIESLLSLMAGNLGIWKILKICKVEEIVISACTWKKCQ